MRRWSSVSGTDRQPDGRDVEKHLGSGLIKGIGPKYARLIVSRFGADSLKVVRENPYRLAVEIRGIGFRTADAVASGLGFEKTGYVRLRGGLLYTLNRLAEEGHCFAVRERLLEAGSRLLEVEEALLGPALDEMIHVQDVVASPVPETGETAVYLPRFYYSETGVRSRLKKIAETAPERPAPGQPPVSGGIEYDEDQLRAVHTARTSKIMVLTGGPGAGKSAAVLGIIRAFSGQRILLAAPTGRAAKRLSEETGMEAKTIRRLLEIRPPEGCGRNEDRPLEGDVLIVDECSMIDLILMDELLRAVPDTMRLILVGDADQLPSAGAGNVLRDIIESGAFPVVALTGVCRQAAPGGIAANARRISRGEYPDLRNSPGTDFFFQAAEDPEQAARIIVSLVKDRLPGYYHTAPQAIQVLTPMRRGAVGAVNLNRLLQAAVNPPKESAPGELRHDGYAFRAGDRVMQVRNDYGSEVFSGDTGVVESVDTDERTLTVLFDGRAVVYDADGLDGIVPAYAVTVHQARGAGYPVVVMPVMMTHFPMLRRDLLYTGVTRAKKGLVLIGQSKAVACCVKNAAADKRDTLLAERLSGRMDRPAENRRYICFDVETPNAANERMSAIGITVVENGAVTREFFSFVNPEQPFDSFNTRLTGISAETVAGAPTFAELWPRIEPLMTGGILVAHNAAFDLTVLKKCLAAYGIRWKPRTRYICTVRVGRAELPGISHRLNDMCAYYGIPLDHHKADSDSRACAEILIRYMRGHVRLGRYIYSFETNA